MTTPIETRQARILIVDDDTQVASLLEGILRSEGYSNLTAITDPREVATLHQQHPYDLILLDVGMPSLNGFGVIDALKGIAPDDYLPVILVTGESGHRLRALQAGVQDVMVKPFEIAEVRARVRNMLEVRLLRTMNDECHAELATAKQALVADRDEWPDAIEVGVDTVVRPLVASFLGSRHHDVATLTAALTALDFETITRVSHGLVETGRSYGFEGLTKIGRAVKRSAKRRDAEAIRLGIDQLSTYLSRVRLVGSVE